MRVHLLMNEASGGGTDRADVVRLLRDAQLVEAEQAERVIVAGGDGTIGRGAELAARLDVPLGVIPTGTANDFVRAHGLPCDLEEAARTALSETTRTHELARIDGRPFVNVAAAGLAPAAARRAAPLKKLLGPLAYPAGAALAGVLDDPVPVRTARHFDGKAWQVIVACTGAFGGGAEIDAADPQDGRLDLVVVPAGPRLALVARAVRMRRGDLAEDPAVVHVRAKRLVLHVPPRTPFNVDGELIEAGPVVRLDVQESFRLSVQPPAG